MFFMNDFVEQQIPNMKKFIKNISVSYDWCTHYISISGFCFVKCLLLHGVAKMDIHGNMT